MSDVREQFYALGWNIESVEDAANEMERLSGMARVEVVKRIAAESRIVVLEGLLERAAMFIDQHVSHGLENCKSGIDGSPCTCGKRAILAEIDSQFTRSDA